MLRLLFDVGAGLLATSNAAMDAKAEKCDATQD